MKIFTTAIAIIALLLSIVPQARCRGTADCECGHSANTQTTASDTAQNSDSDECCNDKPMGLMINEHLQKTALNIKVDNRCNCKLTNGSEAVIFEPFRINHNIGYQPVAILADNNAVSFALLKSSEATYTRGNEPPGVHYCISTTILRI